MESVKIGILFFIELIITAHGYIISTEPELFVVGPNEDVTMNCQIDGSDFEASKDIVKWFKIQGEPGELSVTQTDTEKTETHFITLAAYEGEFADQAKYPRLAEPELETGDTIAKSSFQIIGVQREDSGYYICTVKEHSVVHELWYQEKIANMDLWNVPDRAGINSDIYSMAKANSGDKLIFYELKQSYFECYADGGLPPPKLNIYIDDELIEEKYLASKEEVELVGETEGMQMAYYNTSVYGIPGQGKLFDAQNDGNTMKCEAQTSDGSIIQSVEKTIDVYSRPFVIPDHCPLAHETPLGVDIKVTCRFYSKPAPTKVFWKNTATGDTTTIAHFTELTEEPHTFDAMMMIDSITSSDLGKYKLMLENDVGTPAEDFEVTIYQGAGESTSRAGIAFTSHLLLGLTVAICVFLDL